MDNGIIKTLEDDVLFALKVTSSEDLRKDYFFSTKDFTRNRLLPFNKTLALMLRNDKRNLYTTLESFFIDKLDTALSAGSDTEGENMPSASAFCQQRAKIKPKFFLDWMHYIANSYYSNVKCKLMDGMILVAFDGSRIKVPATAELKEKYGRNNEKINNEKPLSMMCVLTDLLNGIVIDAAKGGARTSEQKLAYDILEQQDKPKYPYRKLYLCDRAYTSFRTIYNIQQSGDFFLIRASVSKTSTIKEFYSSDDEDTMIDIVVSEQSRRQMNAKGVGLKLADRIRVRAVKYTLPDGTTEILLTNLLSEKYSIKELGKLYTLRWGVETDIGYFKNEEQMEVCPGLSDVCFSQEFYLCMILFSLSSIIIQIDDDKVNEINKDPGRKYPVKINRNDTWSNLQRLLPLCMLYADKIKTIALELSFLFLHNTIPIRKNRHFSRHNLGRGKYVTFTNYKRAI